MLKATRTFFSKSSDSPNILNFLQHWWKPCSIFRSMAILGVPPHPRQKSGSTKEDVRKGNGYYSNKRKISAKRDKDKKIFSFSKNLLNRNEIKRKNMGIWGYFAAPKAPRKFLRLSTRYFGLFSWKNAVFSKSDTFSESKIEKWHNPESPPLKSIPDS